MSADIPVPFSMYHQWVQTLTAMGKMQPGSFQLEQKAQILGMVAEMTTIKDSATTVTDAAVKPLPTATEVTEVSAKKRAPQGYNYWCTQTGAKKDEQSLAVFKSLSEDAKRPFMDGQKEKNKEIKEIKEKRKKEEKPEESSDQEKQEEYSKKRKVVSDVEDLDDE